MVKKFYQQIAPNQKRAGGSHSQSFECGLTSCACICGGYDAVCICDELFTCRAQKNCNMLKSWYCNFRRNCILMLCAKWAGAGKQGMKWAGAEKLIRPKSIFNRKYFV